MEIIKSKLQFWDNLIYEERIVREENGPLLFQTIMLGTLEDDNVKKQGQIRQTISLSQPTSTTFSIPKRD